MSSSSHQFRAIKVSCFKYEDIEDEFGQVVVMYVILVENVTKDVKHILHKRYSDFLELFTVLRELSLEIDNFRFPNKSLFNNRSQFTLDRRLEGFNDFLQLAIKMKRVPEVTINFLGLKELRKDSDEKHLIDNRQKNFVSSPKDEHGPMNTNQNQISDKSNGENIKIKSKDSDDISKSSIHINLGKSSQSKKVCVEKIKEPKRIDLNSNLSREMYAEENVRRNVPIIGYVSLTFSVAIYSMLVLSGLIDTSETTKGDITC